MAVCWHGRMRVAVCWCVGVLAWAVAFFGLLCSVGVYVLGGKSANGLAMYSNRRLDDLTELSNWRLDNLLAPLNQLGLGKKP